MATQIPVPVELSLKGYKDDVQLVRHFIVKGSAQ